MPTKNILIINSTPGVPEPMDLFKELASDNYAFNFMTGSRQFLQAVSEGAWMTKKPAIFPRAANGLFSSVAFLLLWPFYFFIFLFFLFFRKRRNNIRAVVCYSWPEKIIVTPAAALLRLKIFWIELPGELNLKSRFSRWLFRACSRFARLVVFSGLTKNELAAVGIKKSLIFSVAPGLKIDGSGEQDNIFDQLAETEHKKTKRKFFTVGTVLDLNEKKRLETLLQAVRRCLTVIPNLQLIVIGDGKERKASGWLAKKMGIDGLVWFVGEQKRLQKWFDNFDVFVSASDYLKFSDIRTVLRASAAGLPVIGPSGIGLEDFIDSRSGALFNETDDSEPLAQSIIRLYKDRSLRSCLGQAGRERVVKDFSLKAMAERFDEAINK